MHGHGVFTFRDGRKYEGEFKKSQRHGKGKHIWPDGRIFDGDWINGKPHGIGKFSYEAIEQDENIQPNG